VNWGYIIRKFRLRTFIFVLPMVNIIDGSDGLYLSKVSTSVPGLTRNVIPKEHVMINRWQIAKLVG
jgi:hypothetical protein